MKGVCGVIKVLIVDDEKIVRDDLVTLIDWETEGFKVVATATNGRQAMEICQKIEPDIVITDIKMPVMDGIELSNRIKSINGSIIIIFLTAYLDSVYAIQAVNMGIKRYLLKYSLNSVSLLTELRAVKKELEERKKNEYLLNQRALCEILDSGKDINKLGFVLEKMSIPTSDCEYSIIIMNIDKYSDKPEDNFYTDYYVMEKRLEAALKENIEFNPFVLIDKGFNRLLMIYYSRKSYSEFRQKLTIRIKCSNLQRCFLNFTGETLSMGVSDLFYNVGEIFENYREAYRYLKLKLFIGPGSLICSESEIHCKKVLKAEEISNEIQYIISLLEGEDLEKAQSRTVSLFESLKDEINLRVAGIEILNAARMFIYKKQINQSEIFRETPIRVSELEALRYVEEYKKWFTYLFEAMNQAINISSKVLYSRTVMDAINYVGKYYNKNIRLEDVAKELNISRGYFCKIFKQETKMSFITYLINFRVEKAKKLLRKSNMKIYEVAEAVGFDNYPYFSFVFKKALVLSPLEYKNNINIV